MPALMPATACPHTCYCLQDLVIPGFKTPYHVQGSPLMGGQPAKRNFLLTFKGDVGKQRFAHYSRGIRQKLFK